jgi:hypothetical protein
MINRSISVLISREEAGNYGNEFVDASINPSDDSNRMHFQAPLATENDVSTIVGTFYRTPEKPTVDCGVSLLPFPFSTVDDEPPNPIPFPKLPSKTTAKPVFECSIPYFPFDILHNSPSIHLDAKGRFALHLPLTSDRKWATKSSRRTHLSVFHRTLRKLQSKMRVSEGYNPTIYGWFFDETINSDRRNSQTTSVFGHLDLVFDEMKLKTGV